MLDIYCSANRRKNAAHEIVFLPEMISRRRLHNYCAKKDEVTTERQAFSFISLKILLIALFYIRVFSVIFLTCTVTASKPATTDPQ